MSQMITDAIEAQLMVRENSSLCAPIPNEFFEEVPKALYVPNRRSATEGSDPSVAALSDRNRQNWNTPDPLWHEWVSYWLESRREDGTIADEMRDIYPQSRT